MVEIAITGAGGRMGGRLIALGREDPELKIAAAIERTGHSMIGRDAGESAGVGNIGLTMSTELVAQPKVLIDFTAPASTRQWLSICRQRGIAMLIGTTGLGDADHAAIDEASRQIPVLQSPNMSVGVNVLFKVAAEVAQLLGQEYDIEIVEAHHRFKKDAPSGTALGLAGAILRATGKNRSALIHGRSGETERRPGEIGVHALRLGDEVGRHTAYFAALGERLELTHVATSRDTFARSALRAAKWLAQQRPGRYSIADMLGL